ncbi:MAG: DUF3108 domain-containing protein [Elusimicrobiota bacterium]|jgi:hypothetical protein
MIQRIFIVILLGATASFAMAEISSSTVTIISSSTQVTVSSTCLPYPWPTADNKAFPEHERFSYVIRWGVVTAGRAELAVEGLETIQGRPTYHLTSNARSSGFVSTFYRVEDHNDAWLDQQSLTTVRYSKRIKEGRYQIEESADIDQTCGRFMQHSYRFDKQRGEHKEGPVPPGIRDVFGSLYFARTLPLAPGETFAIDVFNGSKMWPLLISVKKRERIKVSGGTFNCVVIEPLLREPGIFVAKGNKMEIWLTDDDRHVPVRMRSEVFIGHVAAEITHVP